MLSSIFYKTLYEKRWGLLWWSAAMFAMTVLIVLLFPVFQDSFGASLHDVPDSLKQVLGDASDYQRIEGFLELQVYMQMIFLTIIYGVILCTGLIAGEESEGTLQTLLSHPVSRTKIYFQKLLASAVILAVVSLAMLLGILAGAFIINESVDVARNIEATFAAWLVSMVFGLAGFALGAATGRRAIAGALVGAFVFASYMVSSLVKTADSLELANHFSPFKYFNNPRILENGLQLDNTLILASVCTVILLIGWIRFVRRDVFSR